MKRILFVYIFFSMIMGGPSGMPFSTFAGEKIVEIHFVTVDKGFRSGIRERKFLALITEEEWKNLWGLHETSTRPDSPIPGIDFGKETVLAGFSGEKRTGGFGIEIKKVEEDREKGKLIVSFVETHPPPGSFVIQALTQPFHIVKIKKTNLPAVFNPEGQFRN